MKKFLMTGFVFVFLSLYIIRGGLMALEIKSDAFLNGKTIPREYTCEGKNISPQLSWDDIPAGTKSLVLICDDPDAPVGTWIHWVVYNIPPEKKSLEKAITNNPRLDDGSLQGTTSFRRIGYGGPCPPPGPAHRYFFKLYALDIVLDFEPGATKEDVIRVIGGHVLGEAELMGKYGR